MVSELHWLLDIVCSKFFLIGPGNCLGLLAGKSGPTAVRGQYYGAAAAIGKVGAFVGTWGTLLYSPEGFKILKCCLIAFPPMIDAFGGPDSAKGNTGPFWVASGM